jgi:alpha-ribazole phosphatase/probable phosphoglycerate mutase
MSTRLFLVRHGESIWNAEQRLQGQADPPLSALGTRQACDLAAALSERRFAAVYCSPLIRARDTADCIGVPHHLIPRLEEGLSEVKLGAWQGYRVSELGAEMRELYRAWRLDPATVRPPGGETLAEANARAAQAVATMTEQHRDATIALVTHSILGRVLLCHWLGVDLVVVPRLKLKTASISVIRLDEHGAVLERLGDTGHLRGGAPAGAYRGSELRLGPAEVAS